MPEWMVNRMIMIVLIYAGLFVFLLCKVKICNKTLKADDDKEKLIFSKQEEFVVMALFVLMIVMVVTLIAKMQRAEGHAGWLSFVEGIVGVVLLCIVPPNGILLKTMFNLLQINSQRKKIKAAKKEPAQEK